MEAIFVFASRSEHFFVALNGKRNAASEDKFAITKKEKRVMKTFTINSSLKTSVKTSSIGRRALVSACAAVFVAGLVGLFSPSEAKASSCGNSGFGAGCVGPRGAVAFNRNGAVAVGRYGNVYAYRRGSACYWRNNMRICP
jgi:hypothetical protein